MKSMTLVCALALGLTFGLCVSAKGGHRHGHAYTYAAPVYAAPTYYAPAPAPPPQVVVVQDAPRDALRDVFGPILVELLKRQVEKVDPQVRVDSRESDSSTTDVSRLHDELKALRAESTSRFENVDQVLKAHGAAIVSLHDKLSNADNKESIASQLKALQAEVAGIKASSDTTKLKADVEELTKTVKGFDLKPKVQTILDDAAVNGDLQKLKEALQKALKD